MTSEPATLGALLQAHAAATPSRLLYTFLRDGEAEEATLTYGQLDRAARAVAARVSSLAPPGARVALLYPTGPAFVAALCGCFYAGMVAVPLPPPDADRQHRRLDAVLADADPALVLLGDEVSRALSASPSMPAPLRALPRVTTDDVDDALAGDWRDPGVRGDDPALLQYTSGSTGSPRGVRLTHANVLANQRMIQYALGHTPDSIVLSWVPLHHDMGLVGNMLQALYVGMQAVLMAPATFLRRPVRWLRAISRYRATTSGGPNSAYDLCVSRIPEREREGLDLSSWTLAYSGSEPVRAATLDRFVAAFAPHGFRREAFYPCYGLAEATVMVSGGRRADPPVVRWFMARALESGTVIESAPDAPGSRALAGCGRPLPGLSLEIVDPETGKRLSPGQPGEIWIAGPSVGAPAFEGRVDPAFGARLAGTAHAYLRTGDLGFQLDGELFVAGRLKDLIIVSGRNLAPTDIEATVEACDPRIRSGGAVAFSIDVRDTERVAIACGVDVRHTTDPGALIATIRGAVAEDHGVEPALVALLPSRAVPRTTSGKVQRGLCRALVLEERVETLALWREPPERAAPAPSPAEAAPADVKDWLAGEVAQRTGVPVGELDPERPLASYGLGSIGLAELVAAVEDHCRIRIPWTALIAAPTLSGLLAAVWSPGTAPRAAPPRRLPADVFIPANENQLVLPLTRLGVRHLARRHLHTVWLRRRYAPPDRTARTVYFLNHTSWWDFVIPMLVDDRVFRQRARYMMSHDVMARRWYLRELFARAGAFSIRLDDPSLRLASLRYAFEFLQEPGTAFYLYPQGKTQPDSEEIRFQEGIGWLSARLPGVDFVPVACHLHTLRTARPQLYLSVGEAAPIDPAASTRERTRLLEASCRELVSDLRRVAHDPFRPDRDKGFEKLL